MKLTHTNKLLTIELSENEKFEQIEQRKRSYGGESLQIWVKIVEE